MIVIDFRKSNMMGFRKVLATFQHHALGMKVL